MKLSKYLLLVLLFKHSLEPLTSLPRGAKSLLPSPLPPLQLFGCHHLPSLHSPCPWVHSLVCTRYITTAQCCWGHLRGWAQGWFVFFLVSFRLKGHTEAVLCWERRRAPSSPCACHNHQGGISYHMSGDANLTHSPPYLLPMLRITLRIPKGYGRLWELYTAFNTQGVNSSDFPTTSGCQG